MTPQPTGADETHGRTLEQWRWSAKLFAAKKYWPPVFGPTPNQSGCLCPQSVLVEYGLERPSPSQASAEALSIRAQMDRLLKLVQQSAPYGSSAPMLRTLIDSKPSDLWDLVKSLDREITALQSRLAVAEGHLRKYAYSQGQDSDGWFRVCNLCGEESRVPTDIEPLGEFPHSVACVLSTVKAQS